MWYAVKAGPLSVHRACMSSIMHSFYATVGFPGDMGNKYHPRGSKFFFMASNILRWMDACSTKRKCLIFYFRAALQTEYDISTIERIAVLYVSKTRGRTTFRGLNGCRHSVAHDVGLGAWR